MMARKNLLTGLTGASEAKATTPAPPRRRTGAVGAVGQSIADMRANAVVEIPADIIDHGGLHDRLGEELEEHQALVRSIREYGQQVPVLVRPSPSQDGRYEAIYGRRRIAALKELDRPVRAMVRDLPDRELVVIQGQENSARRDLTFIEKVNFARQMRELGFERKVICDALHIDKTLISRMLSVADAVPSALIEAIGPAPSIGRERWRAFSERLKSHPSDDDIVATLASELELIESSDARFEAALAALGTPSTAPTREQDLVGPGGAMLGTFREGRDGVTIRLKTNDGFAAWVVDNIDEIHRSFQSHQNG